MYSNCKTKEEIEEEKRKKEEEEKKKKEEKYYEQFTKEPMYCGPEEKEG